MKRRARLWFDNAIIANHWRMRHARPSMVGRMVSTGVCGHVAGVLIPGGRASARADDRYW